MNYNPLSHYYDKYTPWLVPLAVNVITEGDEHLYLCKTEDEQWCVIVEASYITLELVIQNVETSFPVRVTGWKVLKNHWGAEGTNLLGPELSNRHYDSLVYQTPKAKYSLLYVTPKAGITESSFRLSYFSDKA